MERSHLLSLADELLIEILRHVLVLDKTGYSEYSIPKDPKPFLSVLGSCRKLREIGIDILLKENTYLFTGSYPSYNQIKQTGGPIHLDRLATPSFNPRNVVRSVYLLIDKYGSKARWTKERDKNHCFRWLLPLKHLTRHGFWSTELVKMEICNDLKFRDCRFKVTSAPNTLEAKIENLNRRLAFLAFATSGQLFKTYESMSQSRLRAVVRSTKGIWVRAKKFEIVGGIDEELAKVIQDGVRLCMCNGPEDEEKLHTEDA